MSKALEILHSLIVKIENYDDDTLVEIISLLLKMELYFRETPSLSDQSLIKRAWESIFLGTIKRSKEIPRIWKLVHGNLNSPKNLGSAVIVWSVND